MMAIARFVGTTILGGVLLLTPIVVLGIVLNKAFDLMRRGLQPLTALIPQSLASGPTMTAVLAIFMLALLCFLAGLSARTALAQKVVSSLEATVLSKLPGYEYLKEAGTSVLGLGETAEHPVVVAHLGGAWRIGVQTDVVGAGLSQCSSPIPRTRCQARCFSSPPTASVRQPCPSPRRSPA